MPHIDSRAEIKFHELNDLLLQIAQTPLDFEHHVHISREDVKPEMVHVHKAIRLARMASAMVISNCATRIWSTTVAYLHAMEPEFPLYPKSVTKFVEESRLPWLSYVSLFYHMCKREFHGTATCTNVKTIIDMRHDIEHDKPEPFSDEYSKGRAEMALKWFSRLKPLVGEDKLLWHPQVWRNSNEKGVIAVGEPVIFKFMKYPVARWANDATNAVMGEMQKMLHEAYKAGAKMNTTTMLNKPDSRFTSASDEDNLQRLWWGGL